MSLLVEAVFSCGINLNKIHFRLVSNDYFYLNILSFMKFGLRLQRKGIVQRI